MGFSDPGVSVPLLCWSHVSVHVVLCWGQKQEQEADAGLSWTWSSRPRRVCVSGGGGRVQGC